MASIEQIDVDKVLVGLKRAAATAENEEELRIRDSGILQSEVISKLGIPSPRHEKYTFVTGGRIDALYGHVVIEYKAPGKLLREPDVARAKEQLIGYIKEEAEVEGRFKLFLGVILADRIGFVRYDEKSKTWLLRGPYDLNRETVLRLVEAIRGLRRKKLAVDELLKDFGPKSDMAIKMVSVLYGKVTSSKSPKVEALFNDWKRLFSQVCAYSPEKLKGLEAEYGLSGKVDYSALLFAVHTYYALVMKLLAAEVAYLFGAGKWLKSYVAELEDANMKGLELFKRALEDMESGGVFRKFLNITNFIEGDYFSWYLEELDQETANKIADLAKRLADYEPATPVLEPEYTRDLLKRLYQNLVPKKIRHDLGEYYTPDWLAELLLNEAGLTVGEFEKLAMEKNDSTKPLNLRILDPACGSGTFLILTIKRLREYAEDHYLKDVLSNYIFNNVVGFDLNPLAILTARTNYLLAIADLLTYAKGPIEIPIYLADSIMLETRTTLTGVSYAIRTYVGEFELPKDMVDRGMLGRILEAVDRYVRLKYSLEEFKRVAKKELGVNDEELQLIGSLYKTFLKLEEEGKNHVWASIIKNAFAPLTIISSFGQFDYIVGNPPWVHWRSLPEAYRNSLKSLYERYKLLPSAAYLPNVDISILFSYRCMDRYLKNGGKFGFLITQIAFKSYTGSGFLRFNINRTPIKLIKIHDLTEIKPFEGAQNRTNFFLTVKGCETEYPVEYTVWKPIYRIDQGDSLHDAFKKSKRLFTLAKPIGVISDAKLIPPLLNLSSKKDIKLLEKIIGKSDYRAHKGVDSIPSGVYWVEIKESNEVAIIRNLYTSGKKKVREVTTAIEKDILFPVLRGKDIFPYYAGYKHYIIAPYKNGSLISCGILKTEYPKAYFYLKEFEKELRKRFGFKSYKGEFYSLFRCGPKSFSKFKVAWRDISATLTSAVVSDINDKFLGRKNVIPDQTVIFIPTNSESEAYYITSILNSKVANFIVKSYGHLHLQPQILAQLNIPKFDPKSNIHIELSSLSRKGHELAKRYYELNDLVAKEKLEQVQKEIDKTVAELYGLTNEELEEIEKSLKFFSGEEVEEEVTEEEPVEVTVDFLNAVTSPNAAGSFEVAITNPQKDTVEIELQLPDRKVELKTDKEQETIKVKVPPLPKGEHKIPYKIIVQGKVAKGEFTLHVKEKKRFRKEESLTGKLDELLEES